MPEQLNVTAQCAPVSKAPPLVKWPGGKRSLLPHLLTLLPRSYGRYFEPFLGGAALFFAVQPKVAVLSDLNSDLINLYLQIRDRPAELIALLGTYENSREFYYKIRAYSPRLPLTRAARLLYLMNLSFNGIHRVNLRGTFNVPYGFKSHLPTHDEKRIEAASRALADAKILSVDFAKATVMARAQDFVYFDPPYTVAHAHNGFVKYNEKIFSWTDQLRLAAHAKVLAARGCSVIVSNVDHPSVASLYSGFCVKIIERFCVIAASSTHRRRITEAIYYRVYS